MGSFSTGIGLVSGLNSASIIDQILQSQGRGRYRLQARIAMLQEQQAAMQAEVRLEDFGCRLKVEPAAVSTELDKDSEGALRRVWQEQQQKVMADPVSEPEPGSVA